MITNEELKKLGFKKLMPITNHKNVWAIKKKDEDFLYLFLNGSVAICSDYDTILQGTSYTIRNFKTFAWNIKEYNNLEKLIKILSN